MDALMAALVLGAICQAGDRTPWLAAILADRFDRRGLTIVAAAVALAFNYALGTVGGLLLRPMLTPEASLFLLALALLLAGFGTPWRSTAPDRLEGWRLGAVATNLLGLLIIAFADRMQFIAAALAVRSPLPWLAPVGATLGALAVCVPAIMLGERRWLRLPQGAIRLASGAILVVAGVVIGLNALHLI